MNSNNVKKYKLDDYYNSLTENFPFCKIDRVENKLSQCSVRLQYKIDKLRSLDMFVFENGFTVAYKPNGKAKCYDPLSPKQVVAIVKRIFDNYNVV